MLTFTYARRIRAIAEETLTFDIDEVPGGFEEWSAEDQVEYLTDLGEIEYESEILDIEEADDWLRMRNKPHLYLVR